MRPSLVLVTPAFRDANNGNWRTARRWAGFLADRFRVRLVREWPDRDAATDDAMIALHARRSATAIDAWHAQRGSRGLGVVLTGTDLYRDIHSDAAAWRSLEQAQSLVVLQERGADELDAVHKEKARVIFQSVTPRRPLAKTRQRLRALMVGHLRPEKSPETLFAAARLLDRRGDMLIDHIGMALVPALGEQALDTAARCSHYRWLGSLPHGQTRARIQRAHVLVHCSRIEGGAHVIMEAIASGTPVLASCVPGNLGMLGADYEGYFDWNDARSLAALLEECRDTQDDPQGLLCRLGQQAARRGALFLPATEKAAVLSLAEDLLRGWNGE